MSETCKVDKLQILQHYTFFGSHKVCVRSYDTDSSNYDNNSNSFNIDDGYDNDILSATVSVRANHWPSPRSLG